MGSRIGIVFLFGTIGMALGGWLGGQVFDLTGSYRSAFLVGVVFNLGNLALVGALLLRQGRALPRHAAASPRKSPAPLPWHRSTTDEELQCRTPTCSRSITPLSRCPISTP